MSGPVLAGKLGISQAQVSRLENGLQGFRQATLLKFCKVFDVDPVYFYVDDDELATAETTRDLKSAGLKPSHTLRRALANPAFLRFAEACAKAHRGSAKKLAALDAAVDKAAAR
jgi:transcriptional regulator with XRE-family HTH domain